MLDADEERRAREVDEAALVLEERLRGVPPLGIVPDEVVPAVPPELRDPVVRLRPAPARAERVLDRIVERVELDVPPDPEHVGVPADQRAMDVAPVPLELLAREMGQTTKAEDELHHGDPPVTA